MRGKQSEDEAAAAEQKATMDNTLDCAFKALFREDVTIVKKDGTQVSMREVLEKLGF